MKTRNIVLISSIVFACISFLIVKEHFMNLKKKKSQSVTLAIPAAWGSLNPPELTTYSASEIVWNVFEPLVAYDLHGNLVPKVALSWKVSDDLRVYTFILDTKRKFSDGTHLTASIVKQAFEHSLKVVPESYNQTTVDLMYRLEGFEEFSKIKTLSGIVVQGEDTVIMKFKTPLRQTLQFLTGIRFGIYIIDHNGKYLGTGSYSIEKATDNEVILMVNPFAEEKSSFSQVRIIGLETYELNSALNQQKADIFWTVDPEFLDNLKETVGYITYSGSIAGHSVIAINGTEGKIFSNKKLRQALQYLIIKEYMPQLTRYFDSSRFILDPQYLSSLQIGRLSQDKVDTLINQGKEWVTDLIRASQSQPIHFPLKGTKDKVLVEMLKKKGVRIETSDAFLTTKELLNLVYKTHNYDLVSWRTGFGSSDPDGLYHTLGKYGAISTPPMGRYKVWQVLEEGRTLVDLEQMNQVYIQLSQAILEEVPTIHLGYCRPFVFYNTQKVKITNQSLNSLTFHLSMFEPIL